MGRKFTKIDENFVCEHCGKEVKSLVILVETIAISAYIPNM